MKPYRKNTGIVVFNSAGMVLAGERKEFPDAWQFPQGGLDDGENPIQAAKRELYEEVGISDFNLVSEYPEWIRYDFPADLKLKGSLKNYRGQEQRWFLVYWDHPAELCNLEVHEKEFEKVRFMNFQEVMDSIVAFKREIYSLLKEYFEPKMKEYL